MFGKTRAAVAGIAVSLLVAGSTVFMASTAANATAPATYKASNVLTYGDGDANKLTDNVANDPAEFNGKVVTVDNSNQHLFVTDPTDNSTVDVAAGLMYVNDGGPTYEAWLNWNTDLTGSLTSIKYDGKFWLWVYTEVNGSYDGYDLLYSDGTAAGTGIIDMQDQNGDYIDDPYYQETVGIDVDGVGSGIYFVQDEYNINWQNSDLYFWDGTTTAGVGEAVDMNIDPTHTYESQVYALRNFDGHITFIEENLDSMQIEQYYAIDGVETKVGNIVTPAGDNPNNGWTWTEELYWGGQTDTTAYVQVNWADYGSGGDTYILSTTGYNTLYTVRPGTVGDVNTGDAIIYNGAYYYTSGSGDLTKLVGTNQFAVNTDINYPNSYALANGKLYFYGYTSYDLSGIYAIDSSDDMSTIVGDWNYDGFGDHVGAGADGAFYFQACDDRHACELWVNDADGTRLADDINIDWATWDSDSYPYYFATVAGNVFFSAYNYENANYDLYTVGVDSPVVAPTLATGNTAYALNCGDAVPQSVTALNTVTGERTGVADDTNPTADCFGQAAYDPTSGLSYAVDWSYNGRALAQIDVSTGLRTIVGNFRYDFTNNNGTPLDSSDDYADYYWPNMYSIAIDNNGVAYGVDNDGYLYTIDLTDAWLTRVDELNVSGDYFSEGINGYPYADTIYALAVDPTSNVLYGATWNYGQDSFVYSINTSDASVDVIGNWATATGGTNDQLVTMAFDSDGTLWALNDCGEYDDCGAEGLYAVSDMTDFNNTTVYVADVSYDGETYADNSSTYTESLLITRGDENNFAAGAQPVDNTLYSVPCDGSMTSFLHKVDLSDASGTVVGANSLDGGCSGQGAWNPVTKKAYFINWDYEGDHGLAEVNLETGRPTFLGEFRTIDPDTSEPTYTGGYALAIDNEGNAYVWYDDTLYSVDLSNGVVNEIGAADANCSIYAMAVNPLNDKLYGIDYCGNYSYYEINKLTGELTVLGSYDTGVVGSSIESLQFDTAGVAYIEVDDNTLWKGAITD